MRKLVLVMMTIACIMCALVMPAWANAQQSTKQEPDAELQYTYVERISLGFTITGEKAKCSMKMPLKTGKNIDYAQVTMTVKKSSGTTVKTFTKKVYPDEIGRISWADSHNLEDRGTYYLHANVKLYKNSKLVETVTGDSLSQKY